MKLNKKLFLGAFMTSALLLSPRVAMAGTFESCLRGSDDTCTLDSEGQQIDGSYIDIDRDLTIDLGGKTFKLNHTITIKDTRTVTIKNGTLDATSINEGNPIIVYKGGKLTINGDVVIKGREEASSDGLNHTVIAVQGGTSQTTTLTIEEGAQITGYNGIIGVTGDPDNDASGVTIDVAGNLTSTDNNTISVNGNVTNATKPKININSGAKVVSEKGAAIYAAGTSEFTIEDGSEVTGAIGIVSRQGDIKIKGGKVSGTGDGTEVQIGDADVTFESGSAVLVDNKTAGYTNSAKATITGGEFASSGGQNPLVSEDNKGKEEIEVTGGSFGEANIESFLKDDTYEKSENGTVGLIANKKTIEVVSSENGNVTAPKSAFKDDKVKITVTPNDGYELAKLEVKSDDGVDTITVTNNEFTMPDKNVKISATFKLKSTGSSSSGSSQGTSSTTDTNVGDKGEEDTDNNGLPENPPTNTISILGYGILSTLGGYTIYKTSKKLKKAN